MPLLEDLQTQGIGAAGTVMANRLLGAPLPPPKEMQKKEGSLKSAVHQMYVLFNGWITRQLS